MPLLQRPVRRVAIDISAIGAATDKDSALTVGITLLGKLVHSSIDSQSKDELIDAMEVQQRSAEVSRDP